MRRNVAWYASLACLLAVVVCLWAGSSCRGRAYRILLVQWWEFSGGELHVMLREEQGVNLVAPGGHDNRMMNTRVRQFHVLYRIDAQRGATSPTPPSTVRLLHEDAKEGAHGELAEAFFSRIGVPLTRLSQSGAELNQTQHQALDAWLASCRNQESSPLFWTDMTRRQTWAMAESGGEIGVLNLDTLYHVTGTTAFMSTRWFPADGLVASADTDYSANIIGLPSRVEFWFYQAGHRVTVNLEPPRVGK